MLQTLSKKLYIDHYEFFLEESHIKDYLSWLTGEDRKNYIRLEEQHNPVQFKVFRKEYPEYFK